LVDPLLEEMVVSLLLEEEMVVGMVLESEVVVGIVLELEMVGSMLLEETVVGWPIEKRWRMIFLTIQIKRRLLVRPRPLK
jgi:hypothetical protein